VIISRLELISTGLLGLDDLLGGGIANGIIIDIFGPGGSGKTQLAIQISLNSLHDGMILYQDTTGGFRPERMLQLIKLKNLQSSLLDNMIIARITNIAEQVEYVKKISELRPKLVIIENITDLFTFEYSRETSSLEKHVRFMEYMHMLSMASIHTKIPVVVTNIVRSSNDQEIENLNKSISMFTHKKIKLKKDGQRYSAQVLPSFGKKKEILYKITEAGLVELP
jgi:DNA repair protein RAD51